MLMKTALHSSNLANFFTMRDLNYDNRLLHEAVWYHFIQLSMGWGLENKLNKLLIISTIILYIAKTTESISNNIFNKCLHSGLICFTISSI